MKKRKDDEKSKKQFVPEAWRRASKEMARLLKENLEWLKIAAAKYAKKEQPKLEGRLRVNQNRGSVSYFVVCGKTSTHGKFLKKEEKEIAEQYAQKAYDIKMQNWINKEIRLIEQLLNHITYFFNRKYLRTMHPGRRALLKVLCQEDERYEEAWAKTEVKTLVYMEEEKSFTTIGGVKVRSKSEKIIGELLEHEGIKYRYEMLMDINGKVYAPDFVILNPNTHQEVIWEHFGKMGDIDYRVKTYEKIEAYTSAGFMEGRFFMTFEGEGEHKFNQALAEEIVAKLRRTD